MNCDKIVNLSLIVALGFLVLFNGLARFDPHRRNYQFMPEMVYSKAAESFTPNPVLPRGMTQQPPVPGTIPRGMKPLHYEKTPEDALRAGRELKNPLLSDGSDLSESQIRGREVFNIFCAPCHGSGALGDGSVTRRGYPAPPSLLSDTSRQMADGQFFHILTYGQGNMGSYAPQISRTDRWKVILHIRALQEQAQE
ncbi:MAG: cytochrome c [Planctomycetota bacterium]|jgi:mono/diheme cytochrome c family protein|nr:cytochrome c [Planctomycetota bacterium]